MDHNSGHWFPIGALLSAVLTGFYVSARRLLADSTPPQYSFDALEHAPEMILGALAIVAVGALGWWWRENH